MRLEKAYHGWGSDFGTEYTLFDAGLGGFVAADKGDFIGRDAVLEQATRESDWVFVKLIVESPEADPLPSDPILADGVTVGYVSSGGYGFRVDHAIALGYVRRGTDPKASYSVEILGQACVAKRVEGFYDVDNSRLRS